MHQGSLQGLTSYGADITACVCRISNTQTSHNTTNMPLSNNDSNTASDQVTGAANFLTSALGNTLGGVTRTVGDVTGAATRGVGDTITNVTGDAGRPLGDGLGNLGSGVQGGTNSVAKGVENAGQWKKQ
ncbi:hypothetical protein HJFPF1_00625 [Paramyrothecium foliicola]|nr:hypothetical protein HJFPF1_00625 [Paramyrothecium foliicola]